MRGLFRAIAALALAAFFCAPALAQVFGGSDPTLSGFVVSTSTLTKTSDTTLATVPGLSVALTAGKTYSCKGHLNGVQGGGGIKLAFVPSGGLTATSTSFTALIYGTTVISAENTATALSTDLGGFFGYNDAYIDGAIVVNAGGTLNVQVAQNTANGSPTVVLVNSTFSCVRVN